MRPFDIGLDLFAAMVIITTVVALDALIDSLVVRRNFLRRGVNGARKRYARVRAQADASDLFGQLLLLGAAYVGYANPEHTGAWLLGIFSLYELTRVIDKAQQRRIRTRTMDDLAKADQHIHRQEHHP